MSIIVGYDGSDFAMQALDWAMDEAELRHLPLTVAHTRSWPYGEATKEAKAHLRQAAEHVLWHGADCASKTSAVAAVSTDLFEGAAAERLVELSAGAELVVVGSRGLGGVSRAVLGSVAGHVASHARCPVIVVRGPGPLPLPVHPGPIMAVFGKRDQDAVLEFAFLEASLRQLPLLAVHTSGPASRVSAAEDGLAAALAQWEAKFSGVQVHGRVERGLRWKPATEVTLVVAARGTSAARAVLRDMACPVAIVPGDRDLRP